MDVSYYNYSRMNEFLRLDIRTELERLLSLDNDPELFHYQYSNEKKIGKVLGKGYAIGTDCGTAALQFSLAARGIGKGDEVITTSSYIATMLAISDTGAKPVLVDIKPDTMLMDIDQTEAAITDKTKAIMPVHLYGQMMDMRKVQNIAKKHNLYVIEDACQAHLAKFDNKLPGTYSDAACYSFSLNKNLGAISNGGMVITKDKKIHKNIETLRNTTSNRELLLESRRTPAFLDWIQIAFLLSKIKYLKQWTQRKRKIAQMYLKGLSSLPLEFQAVDKKAYHVYRDFIIRTEQRDKLQKYLARKGIKTVVHYPEAYHLSKTYSYLGHKKGDFPNIEKSFRQVLSLPINQFTTDEEVDYVISKVKSFFN